MKVRKFNESDEEDTFDRKDVIDCFINFYDEKRLRISTNSWDYDLEISIGFKFSDTESINYDDFINNINEYNELMLEINDCIEKLKLKYNLISTKIRRVNLTNKIEICIIGSKIN